jgi:hypothetical protein
MEQLIVEIDGMISKVNSEKQRTPFLDIAAGRLDAAKGRLQEHLEALAKLQADKVRVIEEKTKELEQLQKQATVAE